MAIAYALISCYYAVVFSIRLILMLLSLRRHCFRYAMLLLFFAAIIKMFDAA